MSLKITSKPSYPAIKIMPLGDSITSSDNSYRNRLWDLLANDKINVDFVGSMSKGHETLSDKDHEGHGGWRIDQISAKVEEWLSIYTPDIILLHIGTNDISQNYDLETAPDRFGDLIDKIISKSSGSKLIVASIIPRRRDNNATIAYNNAIRAIVKERMNQGNNIYFADIFNDAGINPHKDLSDEVHPKIKGSNKMADVWFRQIKIVLSQWGQASEGYINGTVTGVGLKIPEAEISVAGKTCITDSDGRYSLKVEAGTYTLNASRQPVYYDYMHADVVVTTNNTTELNIELQEKLNGNITGAVTGTNIKKMVWDIMAGYVLSCSVRGR